MGRNAVLAVLGALALAFKHTYSGIGESIVQAYGGNLVASFALYFAILGSTLGFRRPRAFAAVAAFGVVTAFEVTNGFGVMVNVYDSLDILANAVGIGFAVVVDVVSWRLLTGSSQLPGGIRVDGDPPR